LAGAPCISPIEWAGPWLSSSSGLIARPGRESASVLWYQDHPAHPKVRDCPRSVIPPEGEAPLQWASRSARGRTVHPLSPTTPEGEGRLRGTRYPARRRGPQPWEAALPEGPASTLVGSTARPEGSAVDPGAAAPRPRARGAAPVRPLLRHPPEGELRGGGAAGYRCVRTASRPRGVWPVRRPRPDPAASCLASPTRRQPSRDFLRRTLATCSLGFPIAGNSEGAASRSGRPGSVNQPPPKG